MAERKVEEWLYMGQRNLSDKLVHFWRDAEGQQYGYSKGPKPSAIAGCWYGVTVEREGTNTSMVLTSPDFKRQHADIEERKQIWADHIAATTSHRAKAVAKDTPLDDMTIRDIHKKLYMMPSPQKRAFVAAVLERIL
jgi:hypothetical protein